MSNAIFSRFKTTVCSAFGCVLPAEFSGILYLLLISDYYALSMFVTFVRHCQGWEQDVKARDRDETETLTSRDRDETETLASPADETETLRV